MSSDRLLRIHQIIGDKKRNIAPVIPVSRSTWWAGVKSGRFPQPVRLGRRCTAWRESDVLALLQRAEGA